MKRVKTRTKGFPRSPRRSTLPTWELATWTLANGKTFNGNYIVSIPYDIEVHMQSRNFKEHGL